jgi:hypothetical protein
MTLDLDIAVSPDQTNLRRFISTLSQLKFIPRAPVHPYRSSTPQKWVSRKIEAYKNNENALALHFRPIDGLGQLAQRRWRGDSGSPQGRRSLTA